MLRTSKTLVSLLPLLMAACGDSGQPVADTPFSPQEAGVIATPTDSGAPVTSQTPTFDSGISVVRADAGSGSDAGTITIVDGGLRPGDATVQADTGSATPDGGVLNDGSGFMRGPMPTADSASKNGPYKVQSATSGFRDGPNFAEATLWWPTDADPPFASVSIVPGWVSGESDIKEWGPFFASHGIVALTAGTNSPITDLPPDRAAALLDALMTLREENTRSGGPLNGKLDLTRQATMGWSMGGGGTLLAAEQTPSLKAVISMCGWNPGYSYGKVNVPALLFASQGDPLAGGQSQGFYDTIPNSTPKLIWEIGGGDHWFFNTPKNLNGVVGRYGLSWLKVYLEGDKRYAGFLKEQPPQKTDFRSNL